MPCINRSSLAINLLLSFCCVLSFTGCSSQESQPEKTKTQPRKYAVTLYAIDTLSLEGQFWSMFGERKNPNPSEKGSAIEPEFFQLLKRRAYGTNNKQQLVTESPQYLVDSKDTAALNHYLAQKPYKQKLNKAAFLAYGLQGRNGLPQGNEYIGLFSLLQQGALTLNTKDIELMTPQYYYETGQPSIYVRLFPSAKQRLFDFTKQYTGKQIAIVINGTVYSAPWINNALANGELYIFSHLAEKDIEELLGVPFRTF